MYLLPTLFRLETSFLSPNSSATVADNMNQLRSVFSSPDIYRIRLRQVSRVLTTSLFKGSSFFSPKNRKSIEAILAVVTASGVALLTRRRTPSSVNKSFMKLIYLNVLCVH